MGKKIKRANFWIRRKSHLPLLVIGSIVILLLFFNDETSLSLNLKYEREIRELTEQIKLCRDSTQYYKEKRMAIESGDDDLEHIAREQYHMQRPTEDVFIVH
jgi:cell division protein FtsB